MSEPTRNINTPHIVYFIHKWKHVLITTSVLALITSLVFSLFIDDKYTSSVILFPTTTSSISTALLSDDNSFMEFGEEAEADQMIQILNSEKIRDHIIDKFDLYTHYNIPQDANFKRTKLIQKYEENVDFFRTKYLSVKIEVMDKNPRYAKEIANEIAFMLDSVKNEMQRKVALQAYEILNKEYKMLQQHIIGMEDSLEFIRSKGVQDYSTQVEVYTDQYGAALINNNRSAALEISQRLDTLSKYGGQFLSLSNDIEYEREQLSELRVKLANARVNAFTSLDQKFVVNQANEAEKPNYPVRWLIILISVVLTFLFTLILLILIDPVQ